MARNSGESDLYLPLFAGTELSRRSGALTRFPVGNLLGNVPVPLEPVWYDTFSGPANENFLTPHKADLPAGNNGYQSISNSGMVSNAVGYGYPGAAYGVFQTTVNTPKLTVSNFSMTLNIIWPGCFACAGQKLRFWLQDGNGNDETGGFGGGSPTFELIPDASQQRYFELQTFGQSKGRAQFNAGDSVPVLVSVNSGELRIQILGYSYLISSNSLNYAANGLRVKFALADMAIDNLRVDPIL